MKVFELFNNSVKKLQNSGILTSKLDVKILLSYILNINSKELFLHFNNEISAKLYSDFNKILERRLNREPIANIIENKSFWDYDFFVNQDVLTPRNDSEILIEAVLENFQNLNDNLKILDLGTGSGCLILTLLKIYKNATGLAIDISEKALNVAKINAKKLNVKNIQFLQNNWNDNIKEKFNIIISNPPYIPRNEIFTLEPEVKIFNPMIALDGGDDGLNCYRYLAENLSKNITKNTKIFFEIGKGQEKDIELIFANNNFKLNKIYKDLSNINRILCFNYNN